MKKRTFYLIEAVLAVMIAILAFAMLLGKTEKEKSRISVIVQNSEDNQWAAFKYGLKMAAKDRNTEMFWVSTEKALGTEDEKELIEREIENGADAVIVQPGAGNDTEKMLQKIQKKVPVMLIEPVPPKDENAVGIPTVEAKQDEMGAALAKELLKDNNGKLEGKTVGIFSAKETSEAVRRREKGFLEALKGTGVEIVWSVDGGNTQEHKYLLDIQEKVDFIIALDNDSLTMAGECSAANDLHGALVYGIGNSTETVSYLDTGFIECLIVPDDFSIGYESLSECAEKIRKPLYQMKSREVSFAVFRRENLFSKKNQEILFTMNH